MRRLMQEHGSIQQHRNDRLWAWHLSSVSECVAPLDPVYFEVCFVHVFRLGEVGILFSGSDKVLAPGEPNDGMRFVHVSLT